MIARAYQARFALAIPEWRIIAVLGESGPLNPPEICRRTAMEKAMVSRIAQNLTLRGLTARETLAHDRRAITLSLTKEGKKLYQEVAPVALDLQTQLLDGFDPHEVEAAMSFMRRVGARARELSNGED